jgi:peptidyl-prolyl cis-trans isomerase C
VASEEEARAILAELNGGADFGDIARTRSLDRATAPLGGETGYLTRDQMTPAFATAAFSTPIGEIAPLFFTEFGWNILEVVDRRRSGAVPFEEVEDGIRTFLTERAIEEALKELEGSGDVVFFPAEDAPPESAGGLREGAPNAPGG